jgi:hypothetical protein
LGDEITDRHEFTGSTNITGSFIVNGSNLTDFSASNSTLFTNYSSSVSESISSYSSSNSTTFTNLSSSNSTTFTNLSSSNSTTFTNLSSSNSTTFTNLSSSNSTLFTNYSSSVSQSISSYSSSNSTTFTNLSSSNSTTFTNYSSSTADSIDGLSLGIGTELARVYQTTASLNVQTGSQNSLNTSLGLITSSIYGEITSFNSVFQRIGSTTSSMNTQSGSQDLVNLGISSVTGSLIGITNTLMAFTAALDNTYATDAQLYQLYQATASIQFATRSLNLQTSSQDLVNLSISTYTGSQNVINSSVDSHILKQATQTGSQDLVNLGISSVTGSLIGITNGLMAFTSALDNTYATDAQLYQLYHATASLNIQTGSQDLVNLSISTYTGSQNVINSSVDVHILKQATQTGSQDLVNLGISSVTGSLIGITNGLMAFTAALDSTYATDAQLYQLYQATASIQFATASLNTQTGSQDLVNLGISTFTGSLRSEVNLIEAYTASLKGAIEVSGQNVNVLGMITAQQFNVTYVSSSVMYQSGSTKFGDSSDDIHEFTGSVNINGNLTHNATTASFAGLVGIRRTTPEFTLDVDGDIALNRFNKLQFTGGTVGDRARSYLAGNGNNDILVYGPSNNLIATFAHYTNLGIRTLAPDTTLHISGSDGIKIQAGGNGDTPGLSIINYTNQFVWAKFGAGLQGNGKGFATISNWDGSGLNEKVRVSGDGDLTITDGNLVVANGKGIDFSATSNGSGTTTSELLNDYEEGTWAPVIRGDATAGTYEVSSTNATYTKIGRQVTLAAQITLAGSITGGGSGYLQITGAPFTKGNNMSFIGATALTGVDFTGQYVSAKFVSVSPTAILFFAETVDNGASIDMPISSIGAGDSIAFTITYFVD